jgi:5-formyltetrahydrofolate cyclo-ligase
VPEIAAARTMLFYAPLADELNIWPAAYAFARMGRRVVMPKCVPETREVLCIEIRSFERDLMPGTFHILEPRSSHGLDIAELDVVISPGRAFDRQGNRIGRGVGYYDRFFARPDFRAFKCGVAFDCQIFPSVPIEPHDIPMDALVSESGWFRAESGSGA